MSWLLAVALVALSPGGQDEKKPADPRHPVTVIACVNGGSISVLSFGGEAGAEPSDRKTSRLTGNKELLTTLRKAHNGHKEELTGLVEPSRTSAVDERSKTIGKKTRVYVGVRADEAPPQTVGPLKFEVISFRHIGETCTR